MRFIDSNVFVYGFSKPHRVLDDDAKRIKKKASDIVGNLRNGLTSTVHLSEVANIIGDLSSKKDAANAVLAILSSPHVTVLEVSAKDYWLAAQLSVEKNVGVNDCLAVVLMQANGVKEIYSFDGDFDVFPEVKRLEEFGFG